MGSLPSSLHSSSSSNPQAAAANSGGLSNTQNNSRQDPCKVPSNSKINPQTPLRTENEDLIHFRILVPQNDCGQTLFGVHCTYAIFSVDKNRIRKPSPLITVQPPTKFYFCQPQATPEPQNKYVLNDTGTTPEGIKHYLPGVI